MTPHRTLCYTWVLHAALCSPCPRALYKREDVSQEGETLSPLSLAELFYWQKKCFLVKSINLESVRERGWCSFTSKKKKRVIGKNRVVAHVPKRRISLLFYTSTSQRPPPFFWQKLLCRRTTLPSALSGSRSDSRGDASHTRAGWKWSRCSVHLLYQ